ncbi:esterase [[Mycobacterium] burgundiense]|uniref:RsiV family protein n=1 Tax=[Mycobacterium] burgundiense TaxID=3064286 RepID=A0ABN9NM01_9MYCO|nr:esterase [Mycolicibacterium sp. MU0053]CAJ1506824.1 RsiV family protein [Mycolicibacterium sp. MU0053]
MVRAWVLTALIATVLLGWAPGAAAASGCGDFGGTLAADGLCRAHESQPEYEMDVSFPLDYPDQRAITDFITSTREEFVAAAHDPQAHNLPYRMEMKATEAATATTRSVAFEVYQNVGGAHPSTWYRTFNYDLIRQRPLGFADLFAPGARPVPELLPIVQRELTSRLGVPDLVSPTAGLDPASYQSFAITDEALIFYFDRGAIMAGAAGAHTVSVPRSALPPLVV